MRIIAGKHKGRTIELGKAAHVRPTSSFTREALFNILSHGNYQGILEGARVADLFCGSGALGLEALSRGAAFVTFVDMDRQSLQAAMHNARKFNEQEHAEAVCANATSLPRAKAPYTLVFLDPPYFAGLVSPSLLSLHKNGWITPESLIVTEQDAKEAFALPEGFAARGERQYGRTVIRLMGLSSPES